MPTLNEIWAKARSILGDDIVSGGALYTNTLLTAPAQSAVQEVFSGIRRITDGRIIRTIYPILPADTAILEVSSLGISDFFLPESVEERSGLDEKTINAASQQSNPSRLRLDTSANHGWASGDRITLHALGGYTNTNVLCTITVVDANTFDANGIVASGTYTSGGTAVKSTSEFTEMIDRFHLKQVASAASGNLHEWDYSDGRFHFLSLPERRQLRLRYKSKEPTVSSGTDIVDLPSSEVLLGTLTASWATVVRNPPLSQALRLQALGPDMIPNGSGGLMDQLFTELTLAKQATHSSERERGSFFNSRRRKW